MREQWGHSYGKLLSEDEAIKLLSTKCSIAVSEYKKKNFMGRGAMNDAPIWFLDPTQHERKSAYVGSNYYTLILSNHPSWKDYPRRDHAIIGVSGPTAMHGNPHIVFPFNGSKIGICPNIDIWYSFKYGWGEITLDLVSDALESSIYALKVAKLNRSADPDKNWPQLQKVLKKMADVLEYYPERIEYMSAPIDEYRYYKDDMKFDEWIYERFDPRRNGFKLVKVGAKLPKQKQEIWTDGPSVLVNLGPKSDYSKVDNLLERI